MVHTDIINKKYEAFICYETTTGKHFALNLKKSLEKMGTEAFVASEDIIVSEEEEYKRFSVIQESPDFIIVVTNVALKSSEVKKEISSALNLNKNMIVCLEFNVNENNFKSCFPELAKKQRITFKDQYELANAVTSWYLNQKKGLLRQKSKVLEKYEKGLIVSPKWSINKISQNNNIGHIIFELKNETGKQIIIYGYRMFRITQSGEKGVYYKGKIFEPSEFDRWMSDPHISTILWENDEHVFHWNDVNIIEFYGINEKGIWETEVQIAYIEQGNNTLSYSVGKTSIEFE